MTVVRDREGIAKQRGPIDLHGVVRHTPAFGAPELYSTWLHVHCIPLALECIILPNMGRKSKLPRRLQPMLATLTDAPFDDPGWVFESKWDGFRMVACIENRKVTLYSRNGKIISESYLPVARALEKVKRNAIIDGELVALDARGVSRFQLLQNALRAEAILRYCAFDLMFADGEDLRGLPLLERKSMLRSLLPKDPLLVFSDHRPEHGTRFFKEAQKAGLEGLMAKRADSTYVSGARSADWLKIKTARRQEIAIVGFTAAAAVTAPFRCAGARGS